MEKYKLTWKEVKDLYCICDDLEHELAFSKEGMKKALTEEEQYTEALRRFNEFRAAKAGKQMTGKVKTTLKRAFLVLSKPLAAAARRYAIPTYMKDVDENFLDEYPYDPVAERAFIAGANWQKEQMLKDAYVESQIVEDGRIELGGNPLPCLNPIILLPYPQFKPGDKVRIVVLKEKEE